MNDLASWHVSVNRQAKKVTANECKTDQLNNIFKPKKKTNKKQGTQVAEHFRVLSLNGCEPEPEAEWQRGQGRWRQHSVAAETHVVQEDRGREEGLAQSDDSGYGCPTGRQELHPGPVPVSHLWDQVQAHCGRVLHPHDSHGRLVS